MTDQDRGALMSRHAAARARRDAAPLDSAVYRDASEEVAAIEIAIAAAEEPPPAIGAAASSAPASGHTASAPAIGAAASSAPAGGHTASAPASGHTASAPASGAPGEQSVLRSS